MSVHAYMHTYVIFLIYSSIDGHRLFLYLAYCDYLPAMDTRVQISLFEIPILALLGKYPEMGLEDHMVVIFLPSEAPSCFP